MERQRSQAIESLEMSNHSVKCQRCGIAVPIVGKLTAINDRFAVLQKQIKWIEEHYQYPHRPYGNIDNSGKDNNNNVKQLK